MSLMPTSEDQAFSEGYSQASAAGGMVIDHVMDRLRKAEAQRDALVNALERMLRFCDEATLYEMQHPADYSAYLDAKAILSAVGTGKVT